MFHCHIFTTIISLFFSTFLIFDSHLVLVQMHDIPGKFDPVRAAALGVAKGPLFGRLQKGETVTLANGSKVQPSDCISPPSPGPCFAVVCCPDERYVSALISHPGWGIGMTMMWFFLLFIPDLV